MRSELFTPILPILRSGRLSMAVARAWSSSTVRSSYLGWSTGRMVADACSSSGVMAKSILIWSSADFTAASAARMLASRVATSLWALMASIGASWPISTWRWVMSRKSWASLREARWTLRFSML